LKTTDDGTSMNDRGYVDNLKKGKENTFQQLVDFGDRILYPYLITRAVPHEDAEDLVAETLFKVILKIDSYSKERGKCTTWIFTILRNTLLDHQRKNKRKCSAYHVGLEDVAESELLELGLTEYIDSFAHAQEQWEPEHQLQVKLREAMKILSPRDRQILELYYYAELDTPELAGILVVKVRTVLKLVSRARIRLKDVLEKMGEDASCYRDRESGSNRKERIHGREC